MDFKEYAESASVTAIYPGRFELRGFLYTVMGLAGEAGELLEAMYDRDKIYSENSDILWYLSQLALEVQIDPEALENEAKEFSGTSMDMWESVRQIVSSCTQVSNVAKKVLRDDGGILTKDKKTKIQFHLAYALNGIMNTARLLGTDWTELAQYNLNKLKSRQERGTLSGSGEDR